MSQPHPQHITVYITEGTKTALLITSAGPAAPLRQARRRFPTPEAALRWCRQHHAMLIYTPAGPDPARN